MTSIINGRLETPQGAPKGLVFDLPSSMINSTKIESRVQPYGNSIFTQAGQIIKFIIPKTDRAFFNPQTMYFTGNVDIGGTFGTGGPGTDVMYILGSYYSMFSRQLISSNSKPLETIEKPGELVNMLLNMTLNPAEKKGLANSFGFYNDTTGNPGGEADVTYNICQAINIADSAQMTATGNGRSFAFAMPLIGILNTSKFIPLINGDFSIELTLNDIQNWMVASTALGYAALVTNRTITFSMTNLELVYDQLTLTPESYAVAMSAYPEKIYIKSQSYDFGTGQTFTCAGAGALDIPVNIKRSSLKQLLFYFTQSDLVDKTFGGINPNLIDLVFITNSCQYPQRPIRVDRNNSEAYTQVQKAFGSLYSNNHSGSCGKSEFCRRNTRNTIYSAALVQGDFTSPYLSYITISSNKFYLAIDTELVNYDSDSLYSGVPMGVNSNFRVNLAGGGTTATVTPYFWMCYDAIIEMDLINGITSVIA